MTKVPAPPLPLSSRELLAPPEAAPRVWLGPGDGAGGASGVPGGMRSDGGAAGASRRLMASTWASRASCALRQSAMSALRSMSGIARGSGSSETLS